MEPRKHDNRNTPMGISLSKKQKAAPSSHPIDKLCINTIRTLAMDAVQQAESGHPGTPMALAPMAYTLWQHLLHFDPDDPIWPNRDRFVLLTDTPRCSFIRYYISSASRRSTPSTSIAVNFRSRLTTSSTSVRSTANVRDTLNIVRPRVLRRQPALWVRAVE
jgi:hypothetical protein